MKGHRVFIGLGSNLGRREKNLTEAIERCKEFAALTKESSIYETEPWGEKDQPKFLNQVIKIQTHLKPQALLAALKKVEKEMGRKPSTRYGPRVIDLDILLFDRLVMETPDLTIPHPMLEQRAFILVPMAEIAPRVRHPKLKKTITQLLRSISTEGVEKVTALRNPNPLL